MLDQTFAAVIDLASSQSLRCCATLTIISFQLRCCDLIVKVCSAPLVEWSQNIRQLNASLSQGILDAGRYLPEVFSFYDAESKPKTVMFTSGDDPEAKRVVIDLLSRAGFAPIDLGSLREGGAMHEVGAPLSGLDLHLKRRLR